MATIDDVAKKAKVSRMTVSRVINNSGYVKEETRLRINQAIDELKFKPNMIAKSLVTRKSRTVAYVMVNISDTFHNLVNKGFEAVAFENGNTTLMCNAHSASRVTDYINMLQERCIDGVVLHHLNITKKQVQELEESGVHCVLMDNEVDLPGVNCVNTDNMQGARLAVEHLIQKGHTRIGCMHGTLSCPKTDKVAYEDTFQYNIWRQRTKGFQETMKEAGLTDRYRYQGNGLSNLVPWFAKKTMDLILNDPEPPTALYCENDIMALSIINEMQERGMRIPDDMAVVGHDGLDLCRMVHPYLTTVAQPRYLMGKMSAAILIDAIEKNQSNTKVVLPPSFWIGETT